MSQGAWQDENGPRDYEFVEKTETEQTRERLMGYIPPEGTPGRKWAVIDNLAIQGIQSELNRIWTYAIEVNGLYDWETHKAVKSFQRTAMELGRRRADGAVDMRVARKLFSVRVDREQEARNIDDDLLCKLLALESAWDPGATGRLDPDDRGLAQINHRAHPDVSDEDAFDPKYAIEWAGKRLDAAFEKYNTQKMRDAGWKRWQIWDLALAYHNSPVKSQEWADAGWENPPDWFTREDGTVLKLNYYVNAIRDRECG